MNLYNYYISEGISEEDSIILATQHLAIKSIKL
jgi:hypothetical protein